MRHQTLRKTLVVLLLTLTTSACAGTKGNFSHSSGELRPAYAAECAPRFAAAEGSPSCTQAQPAEKNPSFAPSDKGRIADAVERLAPETSGTADVFFVGFAGFGDQQVFRKEEQFARQVIAKRYGSESRSLDLVNDTSLPDTYAAASLDNLRLALSAVGTKMNVDEDVLVLMLTSHGYPKEGIAVVNNDTDSPPLRPKDLRKALDASGIKWRIVIVSACYAGAFIKPLRNDTTLIVTAADARHSSFGCEDERELTYFGEAFFRDALPKSRSIEAAFNLARNIVRTRESSEGMVHSNPQLYVGKQMRAKLVALESRSP